MLIPLFRTSLSGLLIPWLVLLNTPAIAQIPTLEKNKPGATFPAPKLPEPNGDLGETDLSLRDGDMVFVPMAPTINLREIRKLALLDFAADVTASRTVAVVGEVRRPGAYNVVQPQ
ncbi:MAG: hypothetical protein F6J87_06930 [Spirulina sp. SIO3F2]|nr:hypothetical protein [Spirulina sp. SIO3F2]